MNNDETKTSDNVIEPAVDINIRQGIRVQSDDKSHYGRVWLVDTLEDGSTRETELREVYGITFVADPNTYERAKLTIVLGGNVTMDLLDHKFVSIVQEEAARLANSFEISDNHSSEVKMSLE